MTLFVTRDPGSNTCLFWADEPRLMQDRWVGGGDYAKVCLRFAKNLIGKSIPTSRTTKIQVTITS